MDRCSVYLTILKKDLIRAWAIEELSELLEYNDQTERTLSFSKGEVEVVTLHYSEVSEAVLGFELELKKNMIAYSKRWEGVQYCFEGGEFHLRFDAQGNPKEYDFAEDYHVRLSDLLVAQERGNLVELLQELKTKFYLPNWYQVSINSCLVDTLAVPNV